MRAEGAIRASFTIPGMHSWQRPRARHVGGKLIFFTDERTRAFVNLVADLARANMPRAIARHYGLTVRAFTKDLRSRDPDRILNGVLDGLVRSGQVPDDRYCWWQNVERILTREAERIEVEVFEIEPVREGSLV